MTGLLLFNNSSKTFAQKIEWAAFWYQTKFSKRPTLIYCNPGDYVAGDFGDLKVLPFKATLPNHFFVSNGQADDGEGGSDDDK